MENNPPLAVAIMGHKPLPENRIIDQNMLTPIRNYLMKETNLIHEGKN